MIPWLPNEPLAGKMLSALGIKSVEELFSDIPQDIRTGELKLPSGQSEPQVRQALYDIIARDKGARDLPTFLGAGVYDHYVPSAVNAIVGRSEFYTAYTPYQPEASQGMLQALFEYQSLIAELTAMDVVNATLYDGATALGEAALMCARITHRRTFIVPRAISWERRAVLESYAKASGLRIEEIPYDEKGQLSLSHLVLGDDVAGVYIEQPNVFGVLEEAANEVTEMCGDRALVVVGVNPISLGAIKPPGKYGEGGADIMIGEGQPLGNPMALGGSLFGLFGCKRQYARQIPGRVIGMTRDAEGRRAFCMTIQTREQHIRRGKATSNICSNQSLCALAAAVYLGLLGPGLRQLALTCMAKAARLRRSIGEIEGFEVPFEAPHFNEFVARSAIDPGVLNGELLRRGVIGGYSLKKRFPELGNAALYAVTELTTEEHMDTLVRALADVRGGHA